MRTGRAHGIFRAAIIGALSGAALAGGALAQVTQRVSVTSAGLQSTGPTSFDGVAASGDGRFIAFGSIASDLVPGDMNNKVDVFVRDRQLGTTELVSVDFSGADSNQPRISADGRYVAFVNQGIVFLRDRLLGTTERVSVDSGGAPALGTSGNPAISVDGRFVAFSSNAANLVAGDANGVEDVFVRDRQLGTTEIVSLGSAGVQGNMASFRPSISADGRYVAFVSQADNLVPGDSNSTYDVFLRDRQLGTTELVSQSTTGGSGNSGSLDPSLTPDGRFLAFNSFATDLVAGDSNHQAHAFVRDFQSGTIEIVSLNSAGTQANDECSSTALSDDGRFVVMESIATNLVDEYTHFENDVYVRDRALGTTVRASVNSAGEQGGAPSGNSSISGDGRCVVFGSYASNLVPADTNGAVDTFVRDLIGGPSFTSLCDPGAGGVIACPCANPPSGPGRGCDNSAGTGGAVLSAAGGTYLSSDSLVFTTSGEKPTATSVLLQGTSAVVNGSVYGQGVRCVGGTLKRLFAKAASGGSITAPNFVAGDPTVSARSAAKGNPISAGESRWYLVFYRDPIVLGGCPSGSTFNATQTGEIAWSP